MMISGLPFIKWRKNVLNDLREVYSKAMPIDHMEQNTTRFEMTSYTSFGILVSSSAYGFK